MLGTYIAGVPMRFLLDVTPVILGIANMIVYVRMALAGDGGYDFGRYDSRSASTPLPQLESKCSGGKAEKDEVGEQCGEIV